MICHNPPNIKPKPLAFIWAGLAQTESCRFYSHFAIGSYATWVAANLKWAAIKPIKQLLTSAGGAARWI